MTLLKSAQARRILATHHQRLQTALAIVADAAAEEIRERFEMPGPDFVVENPLIEMVRELIDDIARQLPKPD